MSSTGGAEPLSDLSLDFVDLERLQKSRFLFQFGTPRLHDPVCSVFVVAALINHLLDGHFPFLKTHRLFLVDFRVGGDVCMLVSSGQGLFAEPWTAEWHDSLPFASHPKASHTAPETASHASAPNAPQSSETDARLPGPTPAPATRF
jgi:hypothetical protein